MSDLDRGDAARVRNTLTEVWAALGRIEAGEAAVDALGDFTLTTSAAVLAARDAFDRLSASEAALRAALDKIADWNGCGQDDRAAPEWCRLGSHDEPGSVSIARAALRGGDEQ